MIVAFILLTLLFFEELNDPHAIAVHLFKNWWGGFAGDAAIFELHCGEHATWSLGTSAGPYGTGPYGMTFGNHLINVSPGSGDNMDWLHLPSCEWDDSFNSLFVTYLMSMFCREARLSHPFQRCVACRSSS